MTIYLKISSIFYIIIILVIQLILCYDDCY